MKSTVVLSDRANFVNKAGNSLRVLYEWRNSSDSIKRYILTIAAREICLQAERTFALHVRNPLSS